MTLTTDYSGVVINQNANPTGSWDWQGNAGGLVYQTFTIPSNYTRGTGSDTNTPDLSGFQLNVNVPTTAPAAATINYTLDYYDQGWITVASGTQIGCHVAGNCWMDVVFPTSVPVITAMIAGDLNPEAILRIGVSTTTITSGPYQLPVTYNASSNMYVINGFGYTATLESGTPFPITIGNTPAFLYQNGGGATYSYQYGVNSINLTSPTPLTGSTSSQGQAYQADGFTPLLGSIEGQAITSSLGFRILGLVADSGTDFLGNDYRSAVINASIGNTDSTTPATGGTTGGAYFGSAGAAYFLSAPQPSKFAVIPTYWDVRPNAVQNSFGVGNLITDPSAEYDVAGANSAFSWSDNSFGSDPTDNDTPTSLKIVTYWASAGKQSFGYTVALSANQNQYRASDYIPVQANQTYAFGLEFMTQDDTSVNSGSGIQPSIQVIAFDSNEDQTASWSIAYTGDSKDGTIDSLQLPNLLMPANTTQVKVMFGFQCNATGGGIGEAAFDSIIFSQTAQVTPYFDGDTPGCQWSGNAGDSTSVQIVSPSVADDSIVIDSIMVDPNTPNMAFNVYYSTDDAGTSDSMTESDWENKLWNRVPQVFLCTSKQTYALPEPIVAKYVCVEFTNLQAQTYDPGSFQNPVSYKKFPTWVASFFVTELNQPSMVSNTVQVQYDAIDFAYNYYLDDLDQSPQNPVAAPTTLSSQLTSYFNNASASSGLDATTVAQINLVMNIFAQGLQNNVDTSTVLGAYAASLYTSDTPPNVTYENSVVPAIDYSTVTSLAREPVIFENSLPVMFFFLNCRHAYKEVSAPFDYNRAYFCGINDIAFLRNDYTVEQDSSLYIETGIDSQNTELNDFVIDIDGAWYTYGN